MQYNFRKATSYDIPDIWEIIKGAISRRAAEGSNQWQDGYPNEEIINNDIAQENGYVLIDKDEVIGYCAIMINDEPAYENIDGKWLTTGDFVVFHRVAIAKNHLGKGLAKTIIENIERFALRHHVPSVKADTNFDNAAMLKTFEKMEYTYCGEVFFRGSTRKAFEKLLQ